MSGDRIGIGVDVGGTFTDVALSIGDDLVTAKVPTTNDQSVGVVEAIETACETAAVDPSSVDAFVHATTVSVNALLERDGATTALVTTAGFGDVLEIGRQDRPSLYDLTAERPTPLIPRRRRFEIDERATVEGIERAADPADVVELAAEIDDTGAEAVAICLLHAYAHPANERLVAEILETELDVPVSTSHEVLATFREFERCSTTAVDAYVAPTVSAYLGRLAERAAAAGLPTPRVMRSNGGIADVDHVRKHAVSTVLSGPAAGAVGAASSVAEHPHEGLVTVDMGGTSTDVSLVLDGRVERTTEATVDRLPIATPTVDVTTVGAGGGSIARVDAGGALRVGPRSAGADPGPVCYGRGGTEPTVTDAAVVLGFVGPETALGGELRVDVEAAREALSELAEQADLEDAVAAAAGVYRVATATMTRSIRGVTVERGHDPRRLTLVAFGGAGPMFAAALATELDVERVVIPNPAGVLSAYGLLAAPEVHDAVRTVREPLSTVDDDVLADALDELVDAVLDDVSDPTAATVERSVDCRYIGQRFEITVPVPDEDTGVDVSSLARRFEAIHERTNGYALDADAETVTLRVSATVQPTAPSARHRGSAGDARLGRREVTFPEDGVRGVTILDPERLEPGAVVEAPGILESPEHTTILPPGWLGRLREDGGFLLEVER